MRIGFDIRALSTASGRRGIGSYIRGLLAELAREVEAGGDELLLFRSGGGAGSGDGLALAGVRRVTLSRPARGITLWDQIAWPPLLARLRVNVFHSPFYAIPWLRPPGCSLVQTVHDLTPLRLPASVSKHNARIFRLNFRLARGADRLIVPSECTRGDVEAMLSYPSKKIAVIPEAADIAAADIAAADAVRADVLSRLGMSRPYLLHTGGHDVVKNLPGLLDAFALLAGQGRDIELVIAGEHGPPTAPIIARAAMLGLLDRVRLPGFVPRRDLIALYRGAAAVVYPSWAEGFGLPVIEAMTCGAPVVASGAGALAEVGGDACLYADPADVAAMASQAARILDEPSLAADLSRRGRARAQRYTWGETARRTLQVYREVAG